MREFAPRTQQRDGGGTAPGRGKYSAGIPWTRHITRWAASSNKPLHHEARAQLPTPPRVPDPPPPYNPIPIDPRLFNQAFGSGTSGGSLSLEEDGLEEVRAGSATGDRANAGDERVRETEKERRIE